MDNLHDEVNGPDSIMMATPLNLRITVLLLPDHQNLNIVGAMDYLNNHSQAYLSKLPTLLAS
jgi:hypothetical protein